MNPKQRLFVEEYLKCWNASEAARRAGYKTKASVQGTRLLANDSVKEAIKARLAEKTMQADEVLTRLAEQARGEVGQYLTENGKLDFAKLIADGKQHLVKSVKDTQWGLAIEFYDAQSALVHIGRHHGLFTDNVAFDLSKMSDDEIAKLVGPVLARFGIGVVAPARTGLDSSATPTATGV